MIIKKSCGRSKPFAPKKTAVCPNPAARLKHQINRKDTTEKISFLYCPAKLAAETGVQEGIMLVLLHHWITINQEKRRNYYDGTWWTYNSLKELERLLPFWTRSQIRTILESLIKNEFLVKGCFNKWAADRTAWYALSKSGQQLIDRTARRKPEQPFAYSQRRMNCDF